MSRVIRLDGCEPEVQELLTKARDAAAVAYMAVLPTRWTFMTFLTLEDHALVIRCVPTETPEIPDELVAILEGGLR